MRNKNPLALRMIRYARKARNLFFDERGNIAIMTALLAPVLLGAAGFSMDLANSIYIRQRLNKAAEAAVLAAVSQTAATSGGGYSNTAWLSSFGNNVFQGNASHLSIGTITPTFSVTKNGNGGVTAAISFTANVPTIFSGVLGIKSLTVSGSAQAIGNPITYINYYIVVDNSESMALGATAADMQTLYNRTLAYGNSTATEPGCVFACHSIQAGRTYSNEYLAHNISPSITLRMDSAVSAVQSIINAAQSAAGSKQNIKLGLYTISYNSATGTYLSTVAAPSTNYTSLLSSAATIQEDPITLQNTDWTDFSTELTDFNKLLPSNGTGVSAASPLNYVFIITDGVTDTPGACNMSGHCVTPLNVSLCTTLKAKATVGVIYTTYLPIYYQNNSALGFDTDYGLLVNPIANQIQPNLLACATSANYFYEASDGPSISTGMQVLFAASQQSARLTQ